MFALYLHPRSCHLNVIDGVQSRIGQELPCGIRGSGGYRVRRPGRSAGGSLGGGDSPWALGPKPLIDLPSIRWPGDRAVVIALDRSVP